MMSCPLLVHAAGHEQLIEVFVMALQSVLHSWITFPHPDHQDSIWAWSTAHAVQRRSQGNSKTLGQPSNSDNNHFQEWHLMGAYSWGRIDSAIGLVWMKSGTLLYFEQGCMLVHLENVLPQAYLYGALFESWLCIWVRFFCVSLIRLYWRFRFVPFSWQNAGGGQQTIPLETMDDSISFIEKQWGAAYLRNGTDRNKQFWFALIYFYMHLCEHECIQTRANVLHYIEHFGRSQSDPKVVRHAVYADGVIWYADSMQYRDGVAPCHTSRVCSM